MHDMESKVTNLRMLKKLCENTKIAEGICH